MNEKQRIVLRDAKGQPSIVMGFRHGNFVVYCINEEDGLWSLSTAGDTRHLLALFCIDRLMHDADSHEVNEQVSLLRAIATIFDLSGLSGCSPETLEKMATILEQSVGLSELDTPIANDLDDNHINWPIDGSLYRYWHWRKSNRVGVK